MARSGDPGRTGSSRDQDFHYSGKPLNRCLQCAVTVYYCNFM